MAYKIKLKKKKEKNSYTIKKGIHTFKTLKDFQNYLRKSKNAPDYVKVGKIVYTMEEYDWQGKNISYRNKRTTKGFNLETENRYGEKGYKDAVLSRNEGFYRTDISYYD